VVSDAPTTAGCGDEVSTLTRDVIRVTRDVIRVTRDVSQGDAGRQLVSAH
jgi:hypothetical protein